MTFDSEQPYPKTPLAMTALPGSVQMEWKRCGKARCRCMRGGPPHGPYARHVWREDGSTRRVYVRLADAALVRARCEQTRDRRMSQRAFRRMLREQVQLTRSVVEAARDVRRLQYARATGDVTMLRDLVSRWGGTT